MTATYDPTLDPTLDPALDPALAPHDAAGLEPAPPAPAPAPETAASPGLVGLPVVVVGGTGLVLTNLGVLSAGAATATLTILLGCTVLGLAAATAWAAAIGDGVSASIFAVFGGFYASYVALSLALAHEWFGPGTDAATASNAWLVCWTVVITLILPLGLRLPWSTFAMLAFVEVALVLLLLGGLTEEVALVRAGALAVAGFVAIVAYQYVDLVWSALGGRRLPLGRPLVGSAPLP